MASAPMVNLDGPPPPAPGMTRRAEPPMAGAMGASPGVSPAAMPQAIIERAMIAEQAITELAQMVSTLVPVVAQIIDLLRQSVAGQIQGGQQPQLPQGGPMMGMGAAPQPGPGAAPPMM